MAYANGRFPSSALSPITRAVNGQQAFLAHDAARAFNAMNNESVARYGVTLRVSTARVAYRPYADQVYFWNHQPPLAARPGTSNHGWGLAVDLATPQMRGIVDKIGAKYGWAKKWSDAPGEWWHIKYRSGVWNGKTTPPTIRKGSTNRDWIKKLQRNLRALGFKSVVVDGRYGIVTRRAVRRIQAKHHLTVDSVVGPATWKYILR